MAQRIVRNNDRIRVVCAEAAGRSARHAQFWAWRGYCCENIAATNGGGSVGEVASVLLEANVISELWRGEQGDQPVGEWFATIQPDALFLSGLDLFAGGGRLEH